MAFNFDVQETLDRALDLWNSIPQAGQWTLAGLGALYVAKPVLSFIQLFLNCFILSGTNVCSYPLQGRPKHS
jgi:17beta-estradiol 17-dehydrogenase / very-long-chain 3-oxoacyl-CoA reductase